MVNGQFLVPVEIGGYSRWPALDTFPHLFLTSTFVRLDGYMFDLIEINRGWNTVNRMFGNLSEDKILME